MSTLCQTPLHSSPLFYPTLGFHDIIQVQGAFPVAGPNPAALQVKRKSFGGSDKTGL